MQKKMIVPDRLKSLHDNWHYSPGLLVGDTLYISGAIGIMSEGQIPRNQEAQFELCFENMKAVLEMVGATFDNLIDMKSYHIELQHSIALFAEVKDRYVNDPYPTWTAIGVRELAHRDLIVEIDGVAKL
jgi:enamine deaminase RidA (YjgF/YER057c/UK114 family)